MRNKIIKLLLITAALLLTGALSACGNSGKPQNFLTPAQPDVTYGGGIITVNSEEGTEYSLNFGEWQRENTFSAESWKTYRVSVRFYETDNVLAGDVVTVNIFTAELEGNGTAVKPYLINNAGELSLIYRAPSSVFLLKNDIDLSGISWTPVCDAERPFTGSLYGGNNTIKNIMLNSGINRGLFGYVSDKAYICDLKLENISCAADTPGVAAGALAGRIENSTIENITIKDFKITVESYGIYAGGVAGRIDGIAIVSGIDAESEILIDAESDIAGRTYIGGIAGYTTGFLNRYCVYGKISSEIYIDTEKTLINNDQSYEYYYFGGMFGYSNFVSAADCFVSAGLNYRKNLSPYKEFAFGGVSGFAGYINVRYTDISVYAKADTVHFLAGGVAGGVNSSGMISAERITADVRFYFTAADSSLIPGFGQNLCAGGIAGSGSIEASDAVLSGEMIITGLEDNYNRDIYCGGAAGYSGDYIKILRGNINVDINCTKNGGSIFAGGIAGFSNNIINIEGVTVNGKTELSKFAGGGVLSVYAGGFIGTAGTDTEINIKYALFTSRITAAGRINRNYTGGLIGGTGQELYNPDGSFSCAYYNGTDPALFDFGTSSGRVFALSIDEMRDAGNQAFEDFPAYYYFKNGEFPFVIINRAAN